MAHTIGGPIAVSLAGEPRSTIDIDIVAAIAERHVAPLVARLEAEFYDDAQSLARAVENILLQKLRGFRPGGETTDRQSGTSSASSARRGRNSTGSTCGRTRRPLARPTCSSAP